MKRINNFIMAITVAAMITSCTDEGPTAIRAASQIEITDITPVSAIVRMDAYDDISIKIKSQHEDQFHDGNSSHSGPLHYENGPYNYATNLAPGTTYDYKIIGTCRYSDTEYIAVELPSGTFTTPTIEEYYGKCEMVEQSYPTANSAELKFKLPDGVSMTESGNYHVCCSTSPDFAEGENIHRSVEFSGHNPSEFSCLITGLQYDTQYYVTISGDFLCSADIDIDSYKSIDLSSTVHGYSLETEPASFTTLGMGETDTPCPVTADYIIDTSARINIRLPDSWSFNTYETTGRSVIYSTDSKFKHYEVAEDVSWDYDGCTCTFNNSLLPETVYYVAIKADFNYESSTMNDAVLPAEQFTTGHANQYTLVNGHKAVDLGLSVKWASCNLGATSPDENGDYFEGPSISNGMYNTGTGSEYDIAANQWGAGWVMPTQDQWEELANNCKIIFCGTGDNEHCLAIGANGNYICIPKAGYYYYNNEYLSSGFRYWTSNASNRYCIALTDIYNSYYGSSDFTTMDCRSRLPIRAVAR